MNTIEKCITMVQEAKYDEALETLQKELKYADAQTKFEGALLLMEWGHVELANQILIELHGMYIENNMITSVLMQTYFLLGQEDEAFELLGDVDHEADGYEDILLTMADYYFGTGLFEVCEQKLLEAYGIKPDSPAVLYALTEYYEQMDDMGMRMHFLKKRKEIDADFSAYEYEMQVALTLMALGQYEEALAHFEQVAHDQIQNPIEKFYYGLCLFFHARYEVAISWLKEAMDEDESLQRGTEYLAQAYMHMHEMNKAKKVLEQHIKKFPEDEGILQMLANLYLDEKNFSKAKEVVQKLLSMDDENIEAVIQYAWILESEGDYEGLIFFIEEKLQVGIEISELYWLLAKSYVEMEQYEQALKPYKMAYNGLQDEMEFLLDYAQFLVEEGRTEQPIEIYKKALKVDATHTFVHERLEQLTWNEI